jgi:23S rRNA (adenine2030-N6)-methyltransferase
VHGSHERSIDVAQVHAHPTAMNYRHAFHAGNFADVFKHALLARILTHLGAKDTAFRYMDTHSGIGLYDLTASEAQRTGEAADGVRRFLATSLTPDLEALFRPYIAVLKAFNAMDGRFYPGSPLVAQHLLRSQDKLSLAELHPEDARALARRMARDERVRVQTADGYGALKAWLPPIERRGVALIDPPFEEPGEFQRMADALAMAHGKWATGMCALWYPRKGWREADRFHRTLLTLGIPKTLRLELDVDAAAEETKLGGTGMIIVNPPWKLKEEAEVMLPFLARVLKQGARTAWRADWLVGE